STAWSRSSSSCEAVLDVDAGLQFQQVPLARQAAAEADQLPASAHHAVAGHHDRQRVAVARDADRAGRVRLADLGGDLAVRGRFAVRDSRDRGPDGALERGTAGVGTGQVEAGAVPGEVL